MKRPKKPVNGSIAKADGTKIWRVAEILDAEAVDKLAVHMATVQLPDPAAGTVPLCPFCKGRGAGCGQCGGTGRMSAGDAKRTIQALADGLVRFANAVVNKRAQKADQRKV